MVSVGSFQPKLRAGVVKSMVIFGGGPEGVDMKQYWLKTTQNKQGECKHLNLLSVYVYKNMKIQKSC